MLYIADIMILIKAVQHVIQVNTTVMLAQDRIGTSSFSNNYIKNQNYGK